MSIHWPHTQTTRIVTASLSLLFSASIAMAQATRPADEARRPSTQPAVDGAIYQAMREVARIPREPQQDGKVIVGRKASTAAEAPATRPAEGERVATRVVDPYYDDGYYRSGPRLSHSEREWTDYRYYDGNPGRYGQGRRYSRYNQGAGGEHFRFGFLEGYDRGRFEQDAIEREEALLGHHGIQLNRGLELFRKGKYYEAASTFKLAAETHHGDPAARLYAAHALFATGRYQAGVKYLRRAFELQPQIALLVFDMRDDYRDKLEFDEQLNALEKALKHDPNNIDRLLMLGYIRYYTADREGAYEPLQKADRIARGDALAKRLMEHCQPPDVLLDDAK